MKIVYALLVSATLYSLLASQGQYGAQLTLLALTFGIFFGTLSLRKAEPSDATTTHPGS